jgi:HD superfamily phosphohydrolase
MSGAKKRTSLPDFSEEELRAKSDTIADLLTLDKTIRDAIHEDIIVTKLEVSILDTKEFQRLHKIKQLGPSYLVYPCAMHTRFEHSLGVLFMTQRLLELALRNPFKDPSVPVHVNTPYFSVLYPSSATFSTALITNYHVLLARTCALLHDLAHVPFGHTLENEGYLLKEQWEDKDRMEYFLGNGSTIGKIILGALTKVGVDGNTFLQEIRELLKSKGEAAINRLPHPFVADIISNTICADLLDYVSRDVYFCGLKEDYDRRFLKYFYIGMYNQLPRLILRLAKPVTRTIKRDVLSEALHLLQLRYSLAEKVYYHHVKISASAMIISAATSAISRGVITENDLYKIGDEEFLGLLKKDNIGECLVENLEKRKLYKPVYKLSYTEPTIGDSRATRKAQIIEEFKDGKLRYERERDLEKMNRLSPGQAVIYCPGPEMGQKAVKTLVDWRSGMGHLENIVHERIKNEIHSSIVKKHNELWNMFVFIDPGVSKDKRVDIASDCNKEIFHLTNEMEDDEYCLDRRNYLDRFRVAAEKELSIPIPSSIQDEICARYKSGESLYKVLSYTEYLSLVREVIK